VEERYLTQNIYICKDNYQPNGICYSKLCKQDSLTVTENILSRRVKVFVNGVPFSSEEYVYSRLLQVDAYLTNGKHEEQEIKVYIQPNSEEGCNEAYPPCSDITDKRKTEWRVSADRLTAKLPLVESCSVEGFRTNYSEGVVRYDTPPCIGTADGREISLTFDSGGYTEHETRLDRKYLIPGIPADVFYKLKGISDYRYLGSINFQTEIFTSAKIIGCGLVEKFKVYKNPASPEEGFHYEYLPAEGGEGEIPEAEWIYDRRFRYLVEYFNETYWIKPVDFCGYKNGDYAAILKSVSKLPLSPSEDITDADSADTLSEENSRIVQELFYA